MLETVPPRTLLDRPAFAPGFLPDETERCSSHRHLADPVSFSYRHFIGKYHCRKLLMFLVTKPRTGFQTRSFQTFQSPPLALESNYPVKHRRPLFKRDHSQHSNTRPVPQLTS